MGNFNFGGRGGCGVAYTTALLGRLRYSQDFVTAKFVISSIYCRSLPQIILSRVEHENDELRNSGNMDTHREKGQMLWEAWHALAWLLQKRKIHVHRDMMMFPVFTCRMQL